MSVDQTEAQHELEKIQTELNTTGMSRRKFLVALKASGLGFGAIAVSGTSARAHTDEGTVYLKSTNAVLGNIAEENRAQEATDVENDPAMQTAQYYYRRFYRRYGRVWYRRYSRVFYRRFYYRRYW